MKAKLIFCVLVLAIIGSAGLMAGGQQDGSAEPEVMTREVRIAEGESIDADDLDAAFGKLGNLSESYTIGVIEKTLINEHWQEMKKGYEDRAAELGVSIEVAAVKSEGSLTEQLNLAETMLSKDYDALCVSPLAETNLEPALLKAVSKGIPLVNVDDARVTTVPTVFVGADHKQMAVLAGEYFAEVFKGKGPVKAALIEGMSGSSAGNQRIAGFTEAVEASDDLVLVSSQPGEWDRIKAMNATENILTAHPDLKVIYACNDTMALGVMEAITNAGKLGEIMVIGTDGVPDAQRSIEAGELTGTVAAFPYDMGRVGAEVAVRLLEGQKIPEVVVSPIALVTRENFNQYFK